MDAENNPRYILSFYPREIDEGFARQAVSLVDEHKPVSPGFDLAMRLLAYLRVSKAGDTQYPFGADKYLYSEGKDKGNKYLPTIGAELEIPTIFSADITSYESLKKRLNFVSGRYGTTFWEFPFPYSYSASTQALLIHTLIGMQFIPHEDMLMVPPGTTWSQRRKIPHKDLFSLHCNLGFPSEISLSDKEAPREDFMADATRLAMTCGLIFTSIDRLTNRKTTRCVSINKEAEKSEKAPERNYYGRIEITPLGFGNGSSYRQLYLMQELGAAFFAFEKSEMGVLLDKKEEILAEGWRVFKDYLENIFKESGVNNDIYGYPVHREQFRRIIEDFRLAERLREGIIPLTHQIRSVIN
jgi:hypothetical protein